MSVTSFALLKEFIGFLPEYVNQKHRQSIFVGIGKTFLKTIYNGTEKKLLFLDEMLRI